MNCFYNINYNFYISIILVILFFIIIDFFYFFGIIKFYYSITHNMELILFKIID